MLVYFCTTRSCIGVLQIIHANAAVSFIVVYIYVDIIDLFQTRLETRIAQLEAALDVAQKTELRDKQLLSKLQKQLSRVSIACDWSSMILLFRSVLPAFWSQKQFCRYRFSDVSVRLIAIVKEMSKRLQCACMINRSCLLRKNESLLAHGCYFLFFIDRFCLYNLGFKLWRV